MSYKRTKWLRKQGNRISKRPTYAKQQRAQARFKVAFNDYLFLKQDQDNSLKEVYTRYAQGNQHIDKYVELIKKYIADPGQQYKQLNLLEEFKSFGSKIQAERVFRKCIKSGRIGLADKIKEKYNIEYPGDAAIAFGYTLLVQQKFIPTTPTA